MECHFLILSLVFFCRTALVVATLFPKDFSMDAAFPPLATSRSFNVPTGHLQPLGWQTLPVAAVAEVKNIWLSAVQFHSTFSSVGSPVVFRNVFRNESSIESLSNDTFLAENFKRYLVTITTTSRLESIQRNFGFFLSGYAEQEWFLYSTMPHNMTASIKLPSSLNCEAFRSRLIKPMIWLSFGHTPTRLQYESFHQIRCLVTGRQDYILIQPEEIGDLDFKENTPDCHCGMSSVDVEMVNVFRYKSLPHIHWHWTTLNPGDCLYIPAGYPYQMRAYGRAMSLHSTWGAGFENSEAPCTQTNYPNVTLDDAEFIWILNETGKELRNKLLSPAKLRQTFLVLLGRDDGMTFGKFEKFYNDAMHKIRLKASARSVFKLLKPSKPDLLTREDITNLKEAQLFPVCSILNHGYVISHPTKRDEL